MSRSEHNWPRCEPPRRSRLALLSCLFLILAANAHALSVEARLQRDEIQLGEMVRLVIAADAEPGEPPDLKVLNQDFRIVGRQRRSSVSVVSGQRRERHELVLTLSPRRAGLIEVPPITIGEVATAPLQLAVGEGPQDSPVQPSPSSLPEADPLGLPAQPSAADASATEGSEPVLVEISVAPREARVAQQVVLAAKVLLPEPVTGPGLLDPRIEGARLLPLGEDWAQLRRSGTDYQVYERRYAMFPERPGRLDIDPLVFEGWRQGRAADGHPPRPERVRATSEPLTLEVLPAAGGGTGAKWLPARSLSLTEAGPQTYRIPAGQALERVIEIRADGIAAADLPGLELAAPHQLELRRIGPGLWDERTPTGVIGIRREMVRITGRRPGTFRLPPVSLKWWETRTGEWQTARLPARDLIVLADAREDVATPPLFQPGESRDAWNEVSSPGASEAASSVDIERQAAQQPADDGNGFWVWASAGLAVAWLVTMAFWWRGRRRDAGTLRADRPALRAAPRPPAAASYRAPEDPIGKSIDEVRRAYETGEATAAREALLAWAALALPGRAPGNLALLAKRCAEPLRGDILLLEQAFFSPRPVHWERRRVWERLPGFEPVPEEEPASFRRKKPIRRRRPSPDTAA